MATWTDADIALLRAAILAVATGTKVLTVRYSGPPAREVTYHPVDLKDMQDLLATMTQAANTAAGNASYRLAGYRKGFGSC
jgi:hypothetical protein